jgi:hypothetical protein
VHLHARLRLRQARRQPRPSNRFIHSSLLKRALRPGRSALCFSPDVLIGRLFLNLTRLLSVVLYQPASFPIQCRTPDRLSILALSFCARTYGVVLWGEYFGTSRCWFSSPRRARAAAVAAGHLSRHLLLQPLIFLWCFLPVPSLCSRTARALP